MKNRFKQDLLELKIVDYRELYAIVAKRGTFIPSFSILVMGLNKDKLVFYKVSTSYKLIKFIESIELKDIDSMDIKVRGKDSILTIEVNKVKKSYFVYENIKELHLIKKSIKKSLKQLLSNEAKIKEIDVFKINEKYGIYICGFGVFTKTGVLCRQNSIPALRREIIWVENLSLHTAGRNFW